MNCERIHIVLASDDNYAQHVAVVAVSILCNTQSKDRVCFHLLSDGIGNFKLDLIRQSIINLGAEIVVYDLSKCQSFDQLFTSGHISKATYFRLDIANLLSKDIKKAIYLDVDLLVLGDIVDLWNEDMCDKPIAATMDLGIMASSRLMKIKKQSIGLEDDGKYFNAGVLVIDLDKWRKYDYSKEVIKEAISNEFLHHDQDALNRVFMNNWSEIPLKWDVIPPIYNLAPKILVNRALFAKAVAARNNVCIWHYAGRYKPWEFENTSGFNDKYYLYLKETSFADAVMPIKGRNMKGKSLFRQKLRLKIAELICGSKK